MAAAPQWKVHNRDGEYIAACKHVEDAAILVAACGNGSTIRNPWTGHRKPLWVEGREEFSAGESPDRVAHVVHARAARKAEAV